MPKLVEAIMEAEKEAARITQEAEEEAKRIIEEAEEAAKRIIEEAKNSPVEVKPPEDIDREAQEIIERAKMKVEELRKNAMKKIDLLVDEIVREVLEGEWGGSS